MHTDCKMCLVWKLRSPGVEPGPCGWEPQILTARPTGIYKWLESYSSLVFSGLNLTRNRFINSAFLSFSVHTEFEMLCVKRIPSPGVEPGPCGWKPQILTARPTGMS